MDASEFEGVVFEAMDRLPDWVHEALDNIQVLVLEEADADLDLGARRANSAFSYLVSQQKFEEADAELDPEGEGLLGLYLGTPLPERGVDYAGELPDVVYIFRRPHLELGLPHAELRDEIAKTLIHEIAHYFGIDDDHLEDIGWG